MRIGLYFAKTDPAAGGGHTFEMSILEAVTALTDDIGHSLVVIGPHGKILDEARRSDLEVQAAPAARGRHLVSRGGVVASNAARRVARRRDFEGPLDAVIARMGIDLLWSTSPYIASFEVPYFMTVWDLQHIEQPWFPEVSAAGEWLRRETYFHRALRGASAVIVGTREGAAQVHDFYGVPSNHVVIAPHPTPTWTGRVQPEKVETPDLWEGFAVYPAQFWPHKNHTTLLEAWRILVDQGERTGLVLVGEDKGNRPHIEDLLRKLGLDEYVQLRGFVSRELLAGFYQEATALVYASAFGPENLPPLEAMSLGCPVVAAEVPGALSQMRNAALLVPTTDATAYAAAVTRLVREEQLRRDLIARGRELAEERSAERFVRVILDAVNTFGRSRHMWSSS